VKSEHLLKERIKLQRKKLLVTIKIRGTTTTATINDEIRHAMKCRRIREVLR
jgi:hypothetical protein